LHGNYTGIESGRQAEIECARPRKCKNALMKLVARDFPLNAGNGGIRANLANDCHIAQI
jgi:hypothetical protein